MQRTTFLLSERVADSLPLSPLLLSDQFGAMTIFERRTGLFPPLAKRCLGTDLLAVKFAAPLVPCRGGGKRRDAHACEEGADANERKCFHDMGEHSLFAPQVKYGTTFLITSAHASVTEPGATRGSSSVKVDPSPSLLSSSIRPPSTPVTILCVRCSPSPEPPEPSLVVKKGS